MCLAVHTEDPSSSWSRQKHHLSTHGHSGQPCRILYLLHDCLPASIRQSTWPHNSPETALVKVTTDHHVAKAQKNFYPHFHPQYYFLLL